MTRCFQETHPPACKKGTGDFARFYGMLIDSLQMGYVNGFGYKQVVPAPETEVPGRFQRAEEVRVDGPAAVRSARTAARFVGGVRGRVG